MDLHNYHDWIAERQQLLERIEELEAENAELKKRLGEVVMPEVQEPTAMQTLSLQEKVAMYSMKITHVTLIRFKNPEIAASLLETLHKDS